MRMNLTRLVLLMVFSVCLAGCLTSPNAFYTESDVIQDDRIIGSYLDDKLKGFTVEHDVDHKGRYLVVYHDSSSYWVNWTGTLFKLGDKTYLDLCAHSGSEMENGAPGPPTTTEFYEGLTGPSNHLVVRLTITELGIGCSVTHHDGLEVLTRRIPPPNAIFIRPEILRVNLRTEELRKLLKEAGEDVFPKATNFSRAKLIQK
jgi:hypothetical protein